ncbi:MAG TPA: energy transducer TonB [Burkholderiaceae bacterium]|nr:energy transducer TonB [Burkholderiaceae bacterium]
MNATPSRAVPRRRWHAPERSAPAFGLSLLVHGVLFIAIAFVVRWKTEPAGTVAVELWGGLPPAAVQAPTPPPVPIAPPTPVEPPPEPRKADIVEKPVEPPKKAPPKVELPPKVEPPPKPEPPKKIEPPKKLEPPKKAAPDREQLKREADAKAAQAAIERQREAALARMTAAAASTGNAGSGPSVGVPGIPRGYDSQIAGCIKPYIVFNVPPDLRSGEHVAQFEVKLLQSGEQVELRMLKSSGIPAYDQAVERAIRRCDPFPHPKEGPMPRLVPISFDPVETR